jgi:hypothetical protein
MQIHVIVLSPFPQSNFDIVEDWEKSINMGTEGRMASKRHERL